MQKGPSEHQMFFALRFRKYLRRPSGQNHALSYQGGRQGPRRSPSSLDLSLFIHGVAVQDKLSHLSKLSSGPSQFLFCSLYEDQGDLQERTLKYQTCPAEAPLSLHLTNRKKEIIFSILINQVHGYRGLKPGAGMNLTFLVQKPKTQ